MALVGQQATPFMTLNQDITDDDIIDFAFTVQGKNESSKDGASTSKAQKQGMKQADRIKNFDK